LQFSLMGLLIVGGLIAAILAIASKQVDLRVLTHYCFLIFAVGPWFAYLLSECLPVSAPQLRTALANMILLALFIVTLKLGEATLPGPIAIVVAVSAVVLWIPQYMIFFVWKMGD